MVILCVCVCVSFCEQIGNDTTRTIEWNAHFVRWHPNTRSCCPTQFATMHVKIGFLTQIPYDFIACNNHEPQTNPIYTFSSTRKSIMSLHIRHGWFVSSDSLYSFTVVADTHATLNHIKGVKTPSRHTHRIYDTSKPAALRPKCLKSNID